MKNSKRTIVLMLCVILIVVCAAGCFVGCNSSRDSQTLNYLADQLALSMFMGNDAFSWNVMAVNPQESFGYTPSGEASWYSYSKLTDDDVQSINTVLTLYKNLLRNVNLSKLNARDAATYRALEHTLTTYLEYYGSAYAKDFSLIGGSYISAEGGYVADFASSVENFVFRNDSDIKNLLEITESTEEAFATYLDFARDRVLAKYPLYDYTIDEMRDYLNGVLTLGEEYYLYDFLDRKIDGADFLTDAAKAKYKSDFHKALTENFMQGVNVLYNGLGAYKGYVAETERSYLAQYGAVGRAYYEWNFRNKTGMRDKNLLLVYNELVSAYLESREEMDDIISQIDGFKDTNKALYDEFYEYYNGERVYLDLTNPQDILEYLKGAATSIVPSLKTVPEIDFKYMDDTVADRTSTLAYYLRSPLDDTNSAEHITLNGYQMQENPSELLTTIAHEGYPGHLYAYVYSKEQSPSLLTACSTSLAFSEGWAMYVELAVLRYIATNSTSQAVQLYCEYNACEIMAGYLNALLCDLQVNYLGLGVEDFVDEDTSEERARDMIESLMENPSVYISYGYGMYIMVELHDMAIEALGSDYDEVEFNAMLLSDGFGPTLARALQKTQEFISSKQ